MADFPVDAHLWSEERIHEEVLAHLRQGWAFAFWKDEFFVWHAEVTAQGSTLWSVEDIAPNLVLLHALGWLFLQEHKSINRFREGDLHRGRHHEHAFQVTALEPDPPDLEPKEVLLVYTAGRSRR